LILSRQEIWWDWRSADTSPPTNRQKQKPMAHVSQNQTTNKSKHVMD
jgi:hypothetical protein